MLKVSLESTRSHRTPPHFWAQPPQVVRKRSFPTGPPSSPLLARKRPRLDEEHPESDHVMPKPMREEYPTSYRSPRTVNRRPSSSHKGSFFLTGPGYPPRTSSSAHRTFSLTKSTVPRRPLGDLPVPLQTTDSTIRSPASPKDLSTRAPVIPPSLARMIIQSEPRMSRTPPLRDSPAKYSSPPPGTPERPDLPAPSSPSQAAPSSPSPPPAPAHPVVLSLPYAKGPDSKPSTITPLETAASSTTVAQQPPAPPPAKVTMVRGRRSPFRDGRRFIPLDDDDSDSDED
ncbi:hypothetical protein C8R46DRAFT_1093082 [Mycena filopes]|nr:hypothetical protein C8R46DRAFT_1093082 [Mycena filopes]